MLTGLNLAYFAAPLAALLSGLVLIWRGGRAIGRSGGRRGMKTLSTGLVTAGGAFVAALLALQIQTYSRLTWEAPVAEVSVRAADPASKLYDVTLTRQDPAGETVQCRVQGDEWILGGRVQKWKPWVNALGMDATYSLDQIANKYIDALEANGKPITACSVARAPPPAMNAIPGQFRDWLLATAQAEDRRFGSANYMPLADGATYRVVITQSGFNAEPANDAARAAVRRTYGP